MGKPMKLSLTVREVLDLERILTTSGNKALRNKVAKLAMAITETTGVGSRTYLEFEAFVALFADRPGTLGDVRELPPWTLTNCRELLKSKRWTLARAKRVRTVLVASGNSYRVQDVLLFSDRAKPIKTENQEIVL